MKTEWRRTTKNNREQENSMISSGGSMIPVNFYAYRLSDGQYKTHGFCLIMQPLVKLKA